MRPVRRRTICTFAHALSVEEVSCVAFRQSVPVFEQAIAKDPTFAPAYAGLALAHVLLSGNFKYDIPEEVAKIRPAAERAIQLDPLSAESYDALGAAYAREAQWEQSEKSFLRAMEIQPGRAESHTHLAAYLLLPLGRIDQAIQQLRIAEKNDPLSSSFNSGWETHWRTRAATRRLPALAREWYASKPSKEGCILGPRTSRESQRGDSDLRSRPRQTQGGSAPLGCAYARAGRREEAEKVFAATKDISRAQILACLGDKDRVFEALDRDAAVGPIRMGWVLNRVDRESPGLLRGDPRLKGSAQEGGLAGITTYFVRSNWSGQKVLN